MAPVRVEFSSEERNEGGYGFSRRMMVSTDGGRLRETNGSYFVGDGAVEHIHVVEETKPLGSGGGWALVCEFFKNVPQVVTQLSVGDLGSVMVVGKEVGGIVYEGGNEISLGRGKSFKSKQFLGLRFVGE